MFPWPSSPIISYLGRTGQVDVGPGVVRSSEDVFVQSAARWSTPLRDSGSCPSPAFMTYAPILQPSAIRIRRKGECSLDRNGVVIQLLNRYIRRRKIAQ